MHCFPLAPEKRKFSVFPGLQEENPNVSVLEKNSIPRQSLPTIAKVKPDEISINPCALV